MVDNLPLQSPEIDVIVPFYNVEAYLTRCLDSILRQRFANFALYLVDDGSTDGSSAIAEAYAARDARVRLFRQPNAGQGSARNAGLDRGSAPFVCFVDSDDYVEDSFLLRLHAALTMEEADIAICAYTVHTRTGIGYHSPLTRWVPPVMRREEALDLAIRDSSIKSFCWNKMFRRYLFEHPPLRFGSSYFEDVVMSPQLFSRASKAVQLRERLYHYCKRSGSLMSTQPERRIADAHFAISEVRAFLCRSGQF